MWRESSAQSEEQTDTEWWAFFEDLGHGTRNTGQAAAIDASTRNQVLLDVHGRCMFEGCGVDLTEDSVTAVRGNFATLAHNVAVSHGGTRGVLYLTGRLADDPENIMSLCDEHHRLVDSIAKAGYPAATLSAMRRCSCEDASKLLDTLNLVPTPAFWGAWPVHQQTIALPPSQHVARALKPIGARLDGQLRTVNYNEAVLRSLDGNLPWQVMSTAVRQTAAAVVQQARRQGGIPGGVIRDGIDVGSHRARRKLREQVRYHTDVEVPRERSLVLATERAPRRILLDQRHRIGEAR